ncbi:CidA/LrgA family protein, partial [Neobacillus drentensis]|uniref:CidA/LrgA family protein n=1 Tax=Neobacillus drentensis TaxID=220684 RepID=UPI003002BC61
MSIKKFSIAVLQIGFLYAIYFLMDQAAKALHLPIPGSIIGMILIFILLQTGVMKLSWIERGSNWLLDEMLLFFIP